MSAPIPGIKWSKYIPHTPFGTQLAFLMLPHLDAFFGGAAGGGKSDVLLMGALQYCDVPGFSAIILRRSLTELKQAGALLDRAARWLSDMPGCKYSADEHTYYFETRYPSGKKGAPAKLQFGYLGDFRVEERYQGAEYQYVGIDEGGHFENDSAPRYLFSRIRKNVCKKHSLKKDPVTGLMVPNYVAECEECDVQRSVPVKFRIAANPGGPGHGWMKARYQIKKEVVDGPEGTKIIRWKGGDPNKPFIPSSLYDNLFIDQGSYENSLQELDPIRKEQLLRGDWDASPDSRFRLADARFFTVRGEYYNLAGNIYHLADLKRIFITMDPAATVKEGMIDQTTTKNGPSFTVISVWGLTHDYQLIWLYMRRFRQEIPNVVGQLVDIYRTWKPEYVKLESNGVGLGVAQLAVLSGLNVVKNQKATDKFQNATNAIFRVKNHRVWFPSEASWLQECLDEVFTWTGHPGMTDDIVDTLSDACNDVTWDAQGADPIFMSSGSLQMPNNLPVIIPERLGNVINNIQDSTGYNFPSLSGYEYANSVASSQGQMVKDLGKGYWS